MKNQVGLKKDKAALPLIWMGEDRQIKQAAELIENIISAQVMQQL